MTLLNKKITLVISLVLILLMIFVLSSCGDDEQSPSGIQQGSSQSSGNLPTQSSQGDIDNPGTTDSNDNENSDDSDTPKEVTVTFVQDGFDDIVKTVKYGETLYNIPTPRNVEGYDIVWENVDFTNIKSSLTVYAIATPKKYTVTFIQNGFDDIVKTVKHGETLYDIPRPRSIEGYSVAWENVNFTNIKGNLIVYATTTPNEYTIFFIQNGFPDIIKIVKHGQTLTDIPTPRSVEGYDVAWEEVDFSNITGNMTVNAVKTIKKYTVTFKQEGFADIVKTVKHGQTLTDIPAPQSVEGHNIVWETVNFTNIKNNLVVNAIVVQKEYTVTFKQEGFADIVKTVKYGQTLTDIPTPRSVEGYDVAWESVDLSNITGNMTVNAVKTIKKYTVTFKQEGFADIVKTVKHGQALTDIPAPQSVEGYNVAWESVDLSNIKGNMTVNAVKTIKEYTVTFKQEGFIDIVKTVKHGQTLTDIPAPQSVEGHNIVWETVNFTNIKNNLVVNAIVVQKEYTVTFKQEGFADIVKTVKYGQALSDIPTPRSIEGYNVAWESVDLSNIKGNITVNAVKTAIEYKINYVLNGGINNSSNPETYSADDLNKALLTPTKSNGATFLGWYTTENFQPETKVTSISECYYKDITLYASWLEYQIESAEGFDIDLSTTIPKISKVIPYSIENIDLNQAIGVSRGCTWKLYRDFQGYDELKLKAMSLSVGMNKAYIIVFHPDGEHWSRYELILYRLSMCNYTFMDGINKVTGGIVEEQSTVTAPVTNPSKTGYIFNGWAVGNSIVTFPYQVNTNTVFEATYKPIDYKINYIMNKGENNKENPSTYTIEENITLEKPTRQYYDFVGWYDNEDFKGSPITEIVFGNYGEKTLYAKWTPTTYNITYVLNGGVNNKNNPSTYDTEQTVELNSPTRAGYTFGGWYLESSFENEATKINLGSGENKKFYAKWIANQNTIVFDSNGGIGTMENMVIATNSTVNLALNTFTKSGYTFIGWSTCASGSVEYTDGASYKMGTNSTNTLYAIWQVNINGVNFNANGGKGIMSSLELASGAQGTLPSNTFTREGYTFIGWSTSAGGNVEYTDGASYKMGTNSTYTLYAIWKIDIYTITYKTNGGTGDVGPTKFTIDDLPIKLNNLDNKTNHLFNFWYKESDFSGNPVLEISEIGNIILYAEFVECTNGIEFTEKSGSYTVTDYIGTSAEVIIPKSYKGKLVTSIGYDAFQNCTSLTSIKIPDSVTSIREYAFRGCSSLTSITIGDSVTSIEEYVFYNCTSLTSVNYLGDIASWCKISFYDYYSNPLYYAKNLYLNGTLVTDLVIPDSVTSIGSYAFYDCKSLTSITIPNSVTSIGNSAFSGCKSLTSITIPNSVTSIGRSAFSGCSSLTSITLPFVGATLNGTSNIHFGYIFGASNSSDNYCVPTSLKEVIITGGNSIGNSAFYNCYQLTSVTIPNSVTSIGRSAFRDCTSLIIYCEASSEPSGWNLDWNYSNCPVVWNCNNNDVATDGYIYTVIDGIRYALKSNKVTVAKQPRSIKEANIPASIVYKGQTYLVTSIGDDAFYGCTSLTSITIPKRVTSIGEDAFRGCSSLISITIGDSVTSIGSSAFYNCSNLASITIPNSVTSIGSYAFYNCTSLTSISLPFVGATLNGTSCTHFGYIFGASSYYDNNDYVPTSLKEVIITGGNSIGIGAFYYCSRLTSITIPDSVTSIGSSAFYNCFRLTSITIPKRVTSIGEDAFCGCSSLISITIGDSVTSIGSSAFYNCSNLASITIPNSVTSIGEDAFYNCSSLTSVTIPNSVTSIGSYAFENCTSLTSITISNSVTSIGYYAFRGCTILTIYCEASSKPSGWDSHWNYSNCPVVWNCEVTKGCVYTVIDGIRYALKDNKATVAEQPRSIKEANIPTSIVYKGQTYPVTSIGNSAFSGCTSLTSITIPNSVTSIGNYAFYGCSNLTSVTIPNSVTSIGYDAFYNCTSLTSITIPNSVTSIGSSAFRGCTSLTSITIPNSVTSIRNYAFYGCSNLTSVTIPKRVTSIGDSAFRGCTSLIIYCVASSEPFGWDSDWNYSNRPVVWNCNNNDVADDGYIYTVIDGIRYALKDIEATVAKLPRSIKEANIPTSIVYKGQTYPVTIIGDDAFYNCSSLTSITIPNSVTSIGSYAFSDCSSLTSITIGDSVTSIGDHAFEYCTSLTSITIGDSVTSIGNYAFYYCSSLTSITIGDNVTSIGSSAFYGCKSLTSISVDESNQYYKSVDGNLYSKDCKTLIQYAIGKADDIFEIPDSVTSIGSSAFRGCTSLTSITIGDSVTSIGEDAFYGCTSLTSITIGDSVTSIEEYVFYNCTSLTIYCEASSKPSGWESDWNPSDCPIVWGYMEE